METGLLPMSKEITLSSLTILKRAAELYYNNAMSVTELLESTSETLLNQILSIKNMKKNKLLVYIDKYSSFLAKLDKTIVRIEKEETEIFYDISEEYEENSKLMSDHLGFNFALKENINLTKALREFSLSESFINLKRSNCSNVNNNNNNNGYTNSNTNGNVINKEMQNKQLFDEANFKYSNNNNNSQNNICNSEFSSQTMNNTTNIKKIDTNNGGADYEGEDTKSEHSFTVLNNKGKKKEVQFLKKKRKSDYNTKDNNSSQEHLHQQQLNFHFEKEDVKKLETDLLSSSNTNITNSNNSTNNKKLSNEDFQLQKMQESFPTCYQINKTFLKKKLKRKLAYENDFDFVTEGVLTTSKEMPAKSSGLNNIYLEIFYTEKDQKEKIEEYFKSYYDEYFIINNIQENIFIIGGHINLTFEKLYNLLEDEEKAKELTIIKLILKVYNFLEELLNDLNYNIENSNINAESKEKYKIDYDTLIEMRSKFEDLKSIKNR